MSNLQIGVFHETDGILKRREGEHWLVEFLNGHRADGRRGAGRWSQDHCMDPLYDETLPVDSSLVQGLVHSVVIVGEATSVQLKDDLSSLWGKGYHDLDHSVARTATMGAISQNSQLGGVVLDVDGIRDRVVVTGGGLYTGEFPGSILVGSEHR